MYIQELAKTLDIPVSTIRYYERKNLLTESHFSRKSNNYRVYNDKAIERVRLIRAAQQAGITLRELQDYIDEWEENSISNEQKRDFFNQKLVEVEQRIIGLNQVRQYIMTKLEGLE